VSNANPYKYEPFIYTVKLYSKRAAQNIRLEPLAIEGISVKQININKVTLEKYKGSDINSVESSYLITPLNDKPIIIPPLQVTGNYLEVQNQRFAGFISNDYSEYKPAEAEKLVEFSLNSEGVEVKVLPPVDSVTPWIPAKHLAITETIEASEYKVGEAIIRSVTIKAKGIRSNQLPDIFDDLVNNENYKIYSETPELHDGINNNKITSSKKIRYTIIPQKPGNVALPTASIKWWNVDKLKFVISELDSKIINIKAPDGYISAEQITESKQDVDALLPNEEVKIIFTEKLSNFLLYTLYMSIVLGVIYLFYSRVGKIDVFVKVKPRTGLNALKQAGTIEEIVLCLKKYAHYKFNLPLNASLDKIFITFKFHNSKLTVKYDELQKRLESKLYSDKQIDIEQLKKELALLLRTKSKKQTHRKIKKRDSLPALNKH
ncbi:BatD family protein, partial [Rickettsiaceae bacterium]|nr:BatD family protein [Rickettsiaceae bacterium]